MVPEREYLIRLTKAVTNFLKQLDKEMGTPSSPERGKHIALLTNDLNLENDLVKRFGLGLDFNGKPFKEKESLRTKKYQQKWDKRRLELYAPMLFKACQEALEANYDPKVEKILMDAIAKVKKKP